MDVAVYTAIREQQRAYVCGNFYRYSILVEMKGIKNVTKEFLKGIHFPYLVGEECYFSLFSPVIVSFFLSSLVHCHCCCF